MKQKTYTCIFLLSVLCPIFFLLGSLVGQAQQPPQREITIEISNRQLNGSVYSADLVIVVRPNYTWTVDECSMYIGFNVEALNQTAYIGQNLLNIDPALSSSYSAYQSVVTRGGNIVPGVVRVELEHIPGRPYISRTAGSGNLLIRIGTVRWNPTGAGPDVLDGIHLKTDRATPFVPKIQYYDPILQMGFPYTEYQIHVAGSPHIPVYREGCAYQFYAPPQSCEESYIEMATRNPIADNCVRWSQRAGPGIQPAVAKFQYNFDPAEVPRGWQATQFNYGDIIPLLDAARCRWEKQMDTPNLNAFDWEPTTTGGRMYFATDINVISNDLLQRIFTVAIAYGARDPNGLSYFKDSSICGPVQSRERFKNRSEIIFSNARDLYVTNPHRRWTTNTGTCANNDFCYDFFGIAEHELGHYIGIAHEVRNPDAVMFRVAIWPTMINLTSCDADNARRLYNPTLVNALPDNTSCAVATGVEETTAFKIENTLSVYPSPNYGDICTVKYSINRDALVRISVTDFLGNQVIPVVEKQRGAGIYQSAFSTETLQSGAYLVTLEINGEQLTQKFVLVK